MTRLLILSLVLAASSATAGPLESAQALASQLGATATTPVVVTPVAAPKPAPKVSGVELVSADGWVSGSGSVRCSGGAVSGWLDLRADVPVHTADGASGTVSVYGNIFVHGSCQGSGGFVTGSGTLRGNGYLYKGGQGAGSVDLSGDVFINQYASGSYMWVNDQHVMFRGQRSTP